MQQLKMPVENVGGIVETGKIAASRVVSGDRMMVILLTKR